MSDGAAQNGGTQAATTGEAAAAAGAAVAATAAAAPVAAQAVPGVPAPAAAVPAVAAGAVSAAAAVPAAVAAAQQPAPEADCKPVKKKAHHHDQKDADEDHARASTSDEDQNLSQPADGCVLPQTGAQAAPAEAAPAAAPAYEESGGGISSGLLIGAGVLAAVGVGVLALAKGDDEDKNAPPVAVADTGAVNEGATLSGSVATNDSDPNGDPLTYTLTGTAPAGLTLNSNGSYTFDANNAAYNALAAGATQVVTANYSVSDGRGGTATSTLTITVTGTNDAPVATNDTAAATEGGAVVTGNLSTNDSDPDTGATRTYTLAAPVAGLTLNANGTFSFDPTNAAYNSLAQGQTQVVTANVNISDGAGGTTTSTLAITVTGTNDAPVAVADVNAGVEGAGNLTGSVATNDSDPDQGATLTYTLNAPVAGLALNANGTYTFDLNNAAYSDLAAGQTRAVVATYTVTDDKGATSTSTLTITVTGANGAPVAVADTAAVNEGAVLNGSVASNDSDPDGDSLTFALTGTAPAGFVLNANGTYTFDANNAAYNGLAAGATQVLAIPYSVSDGKGGTASSTLTITVTGTNDAPVAVAATAAATEGQTPPITGTLTATDPDSGVAAPTFTLNAPVAGLTLNADGTYSFDPTNPAYNSLAQGQTQAVVANFTVTDASGATSTSTLTITVAGTNDAPVAVADVNAGLEDTTISGNVGTNDSDPDQGATLTYSVVGTPPAGFVLNANGTYTLDTTNAAYQNLTAGQVQNVVVNYQVSDGLGGTATSTLTITVTGVVETANLDVDGDNNLNTRQVFDGGATDYNFTDDDDVANTVVINNFGADDYITFDAPFNGAGRVAFANIDFDGDGIANDIAITTNKGGVVSDIILRNAISDAAAGGVISDEAGAEAAIGAGFDNFRTTTQSVVPTAASLDVDNDNNVTSIYTLPVAANTGSFAYTDDFAIANTVLVRDFGADDTLTFNTSIGNVSFGSGDFDGDGVADDLRIATNNGGVVSDIILANAVAPDTVVFNEATAEAAVGNGADNFLFNGTVVTPPTQPVGNTTANLDIDNDGNLLSARVFDASTDGFRFTDDADVANTVVILNLGTNDRIILETGNLYSFTNSALDADGLANDLIVTLNKGGVVSEITIKDAVDPNAFVSNEAQAEAALGGIDYFQFA
ncbi:VCBS repeat-containing protein [Sphingomonas kaistensis]|uniref:VCBS repeat-containing protein n=1 Tax=Sphingomonas kaistensis TaxID=298708 RepID=A0A7X5Y902_9SPHN|nr:VCBS domain-containing protein [Sphingomonas kaistensis]NJC05711.1 VCBS repeat-containing protein [Sphingomonas kaistensis]